MLNKQDGRIIRDEDELNGIRKYITENPSKKILDI